MKRLLSIALCAGMLAASATASPTPSARELLASGHVDEAIEALQQEVLRSPANAEVHNLLCRAYFMADEWDRAIESCEKARDLDPQKSLYYLWLGRVYGAKADHAGIFAAAGLAKKVRTSFERAVELDPTNWEARADLAEFYYEAPAMVGGGKDKAREQADALTALNPGMAHWVLGQIAEKNKDIDTAEREYRASMAVTHSAARSCVEYAIFLRHANRLDEMVEVLRKLETAEIDRADSLMDGASLLVRTGRDTGLGVRLMRRYFSVGPIEEGPAFKAHECLGQLLERQGNRSGAREEYLAALALFHNYSRAKEDLKRVEH